MRIEDPATPAGTQSTEDDGSAAAAAAQAAANAGDSPPATEAVDAFTQGVEKARAEEAGEAPAAAPAAEAAAPAAAAPPNADGQPPAAAAPATPDAATEPDAIDAELKDLGITNERTQKRFRELSERAGKVDSLQPLAERMAEWDKTIESTGASPQQMGNALNYLAAINSGDPSAMAQAYDFMQQEMTWLAKQLGRPAPGYDPLSEHAELAEQVKNGDLTRAAAEELIRTRRSAAMQQEQQQRQRTAAQQADTQQQAQQDAMKQVAALGAQLRASDPLFAAKFKALEPTVAFIQRTLPPEAWAAAIHEAYKAQPAVATPTVPPPPPPPNPARPSGVDLSTAPTKETAFDFGVELARQAGR